MKGTVGGMKGILSAGSILTSTIDKVVEQTVQLAIEQDAAIVAFNKATGASGQFDSQIRVLERSLFDSGVSSMEASQAFQEFLLSCCSTYQN